MKRIRIVTMILLCTLCLVVSNHQAIAKDDKDTAEEILAAQRKTVDQAKKIISEVMKSKNLDDKKKEMRWVKKQKSKKTKTSNFDLDWLKMFEFIPKLFATLFETGLWILLAIGIFLLYRFRDQWLHLFQRSKQNEEEYQPPEIMFGMDVRPDSLPEDIVTEAKSLWQSGKHRESLSLLYRGSLVHLINQDKVQLQNSHTEGDVLKHAAKKISQTRQAYLQQLTRQWQAIAYAHRIPDENIMSGLFEHWQTDFSAMDNTVNRESA